MAHGTDSWVSDDAAIAEGVEIGRAVVIHPGVTIGVRSVIEDHVTLGEKRGLASVQSKARRERADPLVIGSGVRSAAVP